MNRIERAEKRYAEAKRERSAKRTVKTQETLIRRRNELRSAQRGA